MIQRILCFAIIASVGSLFAQPTLSPLPSGPNEKAREGQDPLILYGGAREAALAAFHQAYEAAGNRNPDRAIRLLLLALKRNPRLDSALYDLGILCAQGGRWDDAVKFQQEVRNRAPGSEAAKLAAIELERLEVVAALEKTQDGSRRRDYDKQLMRALSGTDAIKSLEAANELIKRDGTRWEGFALAGVEYAVTRDYAKAQEALAAAAGLAPEVERRGMQNAAGIAGAEARFIRQVNLADEHWSNRRYEPAANAYAEAWEASPGRSEVGMRAATGFLMVDKVDLAVTVLSRLRASAPPELSTKAAAMLRELAAISEYGKREVDRTVVSEAQLPEDPAVRIRREVGSISSDEVVIAARPDPALLSDTTAVAGEASLVGQDAEINGHETFYDSKTSVFGLYQSTAAPAAPVEPPHAAAPAMPQLTLPPQAHAVEVPPQPPPVAAPKGAEQAVEVITRPAQASVTLDKDERPVACTTPCKVSLSAGRHTLLAKLAGYRDAHRIFEVSRSMKPLELELEAKRGTVNIESVPSQLPVFVDGSKTGQSTPVLMPLSEGNHKIGVESEGQLWTKDVAVSDGAIFTTTIQAGAK